MIVKMGVIESEGRVRIPPDLLEAADLVPGEEVELRATARGVLLKKRGAIVDRLAGRLAVDQPVAEEIMQSTELEYAAF